MSAAAPSVSDRTRRIIFGEPRQGREEEPARTRRQHRYRDEEHFVGTIYYETNKTMQIAEEIGIVK
jgi:hypothetical protein